MTLLLNYYWEIFIVLEISAFIILLVFLFIRYFFMKSELSFIFLILFIMMLILEAVLAFVVYKQTGEFTTFQVVIGIFIIYALTFGVNDFKRLDRYVKQKVGSWRGVDLLTEEDKEKIAYLKDPKVIARRSRYAFYMHTLIFVSGIIVLWIYNGNKDYSLLYFLKNLEWFEDVLASPQPFKNEQITSGVRLWIIIYILDSIINLSYTLFPGKRN